MYDGPGGFVTGVVKAKTGAPLAGVTVVATGPALHGTQAELTDDSGQYTLASLPTGVYVVTFYYSELVIERKGIDVLLGRRSMLNQTIDPSAKGGETITISDCAHLTTDCERWYLDKDYVRQAPTRDPRRTV